MRFETIAIESSIPDAFAQQVRQHGERCAIITENGSVTYQQLDHIANCTAGALLANGHRRGHTVAILFEQGILQIAAILGVLKAGGIYVPLDMAVGRRRLRNIIQHAESRIILTDRINRSVASLISSDRTRVVNIEKDLEQYADNYQATALSPSDFAYIYYTSGTTGDPKGVVDIHRNVLHNVARYTTSLEIDCNDRLTLVQSCGFSGAVSNIFTSLLNGAVLLPFDVRARGVSALARWLASQKPTIYHSVPSLFRQLMRCCDTLPTLRVIRLEGDLARAIDVDTFNRQFDRNCTLVNGLGATETGITAQYFIEYGKSLNRNVVPVGKATRDFRIDILDARHRPLPQGQYGEIVITSRYLASGYWRAPDLTNSTFSVIDGETRSYYTRDLGRVDRHGLLEVHGRMDSLVKIRGEWVDLSALEVALARCNGVKDAIAELPLAGAAKSELTAWIVPDARANVSSGNLRESLRSQGWPQHSTPTRFIVLDDWPLDLNGKIDRKVLAATTDRRERRATPKNPREKLVAKVFEQILQVGTVSRADDFFELGGDSLKAVEACFELSRLTGTSQALGLFQHASSVAELAKSLDGAFDRGCLVPLQPTGDGAPIFCVHAHMGHVFNLRQLAGQFAPEQKFFGLQARGLTRMEQPDVTLEAMATTYVACIRKVQPTGSYLISGYCFGSWVAVEIARQLRNAGHQVSGLFLIDPQLPQAISAQVPGASPGGQLGRFLNRLRGLSTDRMAQKLRRRLFNTVRRARIRFLWLIVHLSQGKRWICGLVLRQPGDAIAVMQLDYRPRAYDGDACILMPNDKPLELSERRAWESFIKGNLDFEFLVGNSSDLLREPYTRDLAACLLRRIGARTNS
jgi:amino acid adenylation domain-containing protein